MGSVAAEGDGTLSDVDAVSTTALQPGKPVHVGNAGLVLLSPYLPTLFARAGLLVGTTRIERAAIPRALGLLNYLARGTAGPPQTEPELNAILCGLPSPQPAGTSAELSERDSSLCDSLIAAAISNWTALGHSSPAGLRETFLQRHGALGRESDHLRLTVERKGLDVLVDQVPWSFSIIKHGWMPEPLRVTW